MLSPQLRKIKIQLEEGATNIDIDKEELLAELNEMEAIQGVLLEAYHYQQRFVLHAERGCKYGL